jgi:hypothetical protein
MDSGTDIFCSDQKRVGNSALQSPLLTHVERASAAHLHGTRSLSRIGRTRPGNGVRLLRLWAPPALTRSRPPPQNKMSVPRPRMRPWRLAKARCALSGSRPAGGRGGAGRGASDAGLGVEDGGDGSADGAGEAQAGQNPVAGPLQPPQLPPRAQSEPPVVQQPHPLATPAPPRARAVRVGAPLPGCPGAGRGARGGGPPRARRGVGSRSRGRQW